jgi:6-phosphogluconolactonase (cycloisomerase 2 family)
MRVGKETAMTVVDRLKCHRACSFAACAWLLSSCGNSGRGPNSAFAYVANANSLATYSISASTGEFGASVGSPLAFPSSLFFGGIQFAPDPSGQFLYVLDYAGVYAYAINRNTGALTAVAGSPFGTESTPTSIAFDASGSYLYVAGFSGLIAPVDTVITAYTVGGSGALSPLATYTVSSGLSSVVAVGHYLYAAGYYSNSITAFSIGSSGELSPNVPGSPFATDNGPYDIVTDPSGSVLYTANDGAPTESLARPGSISAFTIDASTGALTPVSGNPQPIAAQGSISIDPTGRFLFVPQLSGVSVYGIDGTSGTLSRVAGSPFAAGTAPNAVSVDPANRVVYVVNNGSANVSEFTLESTGALTPLAGSPTPVVSSPSYIAIVSH